jgi:hypothetical protein
LLNLYRTVREAEQSGLTVPETCSKTELKALMTDEPMHRRWPCLPLHDEGVSQHADGTFGSLGHSVVSTIQSSSIGHIWCLRIVYGRLLPDKKPACLSANAIFSLSSEFMNTK